HVQRPVARSEIQLLARSLNLDNVQQGVYTLNKNPAGLIPERLDNCNIIGIDPGVRDIVYTVPLTSSKKKIRPGRMDGPNYLQANHAT
ncbi:unnamed protein product, partial [Absidia cylindrospora]